ncbi:INO80D [Mytilus edulis]|uniref:INO80D n=1 Tax=Mytilus edulis TaxID=6550 RepID=A0A8S3UWD9_MYTED|nr:INO80D [Mytilus edulis]
MYEGKNIHYSSFDKKPLCSFSTKVCNQHRLNGYAFCVRHILEDPTAPFRRCSYVAKSSGQKCTQAIPKHEDREYCNNHMQVLGMIPRKEKKVKKDKITENMLSDVKIPFQDRVKSRFNINKLQNDNVLHSNPADDPDDPYAFPDSSGDSKIITTIVQPTTPSSAGDSPSSVYHPFAKSPGDSCGSGSSIAKFYPELAEKLEKIRPKNDALKLKDKGKDKSSRTMNSLQTRIAQNRIKSKRRGTQDSSSQSQSPLHLGKSPLHPGSLNDIYSGFANHIDLEKPQKTPPAYNHFDGSPTEPTKSANIPGIELKRPPPSYFRQPFDRAPVMASVNSPVVSIEEKVVKTPPTVSSQKSVQSINHSVQMEIPHGTPLQSLPGMSNRLPIPNMPNAFNLDMATSLPNFAAYLHAMQNKNSFLTGVPPQLIPSLNLQPGSVPFINLNSALAAGNLNQNVGEKLVTPQSIPQPDIIKRPLPPPPPLLSPSGLTNIFPAVCGGSTTTTSVTFTAPSQPIRPPPPPYSSAVAQALNKPPVVAVATSKTTFTKPVLNVIPSVNPSLMSAKPAKMKHVLSGEEIDKKIKTEMAKKYYNAYLKRKIYNHSLLKAGIDSSDDSSDDENNGLLPWQPKWFCASSDEEGMDEEEDQNDVIRTTKLALLRARLRRHCSQSRKAFKGNVHEQGSSKSATMSLIQSARESGKATVCVIKEKTHEPQPRVFRYKRRGLDRRQCLYKNDEEEQCPNSVVPCANHCLKHIMYNIDQQLFDYCTAKTADNVQCCIPVIDISHELPLCVKHAREVDDSYKLEEEEIKPKRPRKKTKPSALTRPPKKGKKKKNQRKSAVLQANMDSMDTTEEPPTASETAVSGDVEMDANSGSGSEESDEGETTTPQVKDPSSKPPSPVPVPAPPPVKVEVSKPQALPSPLTRPLTVTRPKVVQHKDFLGELPDSVLAANLPADLNLNKGLELPLEQASRLLEEHDFQDVLNKIPDDTFDMFSGGKNGEPTKEEMDELERHLAAANMDLNSAQEALSTVTDYDDQIRILASILTNQPTSHMGGNVVNGTTDEHAQENINMIANSLASSHSTNTMVSSGQVFHQNQIPQFVISHQNNQASSLHHSTVMNNMAAVNIGRGQGHQLSQGQQRGSPGPIHSQQLSPVNNQMRSSHRGSPVGQVNHQGSPVGQVNHQGSPVGQVNHQGSPVGQVNHQGSPVSQQAGQVQRVQSPSTPHPGSPVQNLKMPVQVANSVHQSNVHSVQNIIHHIRPGTVLPPGIGNGIQLQNLQSVGHRPMLVQTVNSNLGQSVTRPSGQQAYSHPNLSERINSVQTSVHMSPLVQTAGHQSNLIHGSINQQLNLALPGSVLHQKLIQQASLGNLSNKAHIQQNLSGNVQYCVTTMGKTTNQSDVVSSNVIQSPHVSSPGHVTGNVQSTSHNASLPYHIYQSNHLIQQSLGQQSKILSSITNVGTKTTPVLQQTKAAISTSVPTTGTSRTAFQNGYPAQSAQFTNNDVNSGKYVMSAAHGVQNCTDQQLLQNIAQTLVTAPHHIPPTFENPKKLKLLLKG